MPCTFKKNSISGSNYNTNNSSNKLPNGRRKLTHNHQHNTNNLQNNPDLTTKQMTIENGYDLKKQVIQKNSVQLPSNNLNSIQNNNNLNQKDNISSTMNTIDCTEIWDAIKSNGTVSTAWNISLVK